MTLTTLHKKYSLSQPRAKKDKNLDEQYAY